MTSLMPFLPVAICGFIGTVLGLYFARREHKRTMREKVISALKNAEEPYLPFMETLEFKR